MLMVAVVQRIGSEEESIQFESRRFGTTTPELMNLAAWLQHRGVTEVVMESTAQILEASVVYAGGALPIAFGAGLE